MNSNNTQNTIEEFKQIIKKTLPKFYSEVTLQNHWVGNKSAYLKIVIAASNYEINRVKYQYVQDVSLMFDIPTETLTIQIFGGNGGNRIYTKPIKNPYLAMEGIKIPFRKAASKQSALKALEKFCITYKETLKANQEILMYQQYINYSEVLN